MRLVSIMALLLLSCSSATEWTVADGVARRRVEVKARGLDVVTVDLRVPAAQDAPVAASSGLVLLPGGLVPASRYLWLADALAKDGWAVAVPSFPLDLGFFAQDNARVARRLLVDGDEAAGLPALAPSDRVAVGGHSLGGVVAASAAVDGGYAALVLMASYAAGYESVESMPIPVLSVAGAQDCSAKLSTVEAGFARFPAATSTLAIVDGLTHYGFTDALTEDLQRGCLGSLSLEQGHVRLAEVMSTFLNAKVRGDAEAQARLAGSWTGVTVRGAK